MAALTVAADSMVARLVAALAVIVPVAVPTLQLILDAAVTENDGAGIVDSVYWVLAGPHTPVDWLDTQPVNKASGASCAREWEVVARVRNRSNKGKDASLLLC